MWSLPSERVLPVLEPVTRSQLLVVSCKRRWTAAGNAGVLFGKLNKELNKRANKQK